MKKISSSELKLHLRLIIRLKWVSRKQCNLEILPSGVNLGQLETCQLNSSKSRGLGWHVHWLLSFPG